MMVDRDDIPRMRQVDAGPEPNLDALVGNGIIIKPGATRPKKDAWAKKHKRAKMRKASRKRNRR